MTKSLGASALLGERIERIVVFRALVLGDMLCIVPAMRALRTAYPAADITLVSLPWAREFVARFNQYFDGFIEFPGLPGLPERPYDAPAFPQFLKEVRSRQFDLAIQLHGSGSIVNPLVASFEARRCAGFFVDPQDSLDAQTFIRYPEKLHEIRRHLQVMNHLGIASCGDELEFPLTSDDASRFQQLTATHDLVGVPYVCLHPGARYLSRRWPVDRFASVGDALAAEGYSIVITGSSAEAELTNELSRKMRNRPTNLAGKTDLGTLAALLAKSRLLICNDTGVSHLAAALRTPGVVVVTGSDHERWAPLNRALHRVVMQPADCRPCEHRECPIDFHCGLRVTSDIVLEAAFAALSDRHGHCCEAIESNRRTECAA